MRRMFAAFIGVILVILLVVPTLVALWNHKAPEPGRVPPTQGLRVRVGEPGGKVLTMGLEEYVKGVVYAEMPLGFDTQALAAQAVASRTYAYRRLKWDPNAVMSSNPASHQGWKAWRLRLPILSGLLERRLNTAMRITKGIVMMHDGEPIDAVYHSTSGPRTADAVEVWGKAVPYLESVPCPYCKDSGKLRQTIRVSHGAMRKALGLAGDSKGRVTVRVLSLTESGRVRKVSCNGRSYSGKELRELLGLPSAAFTAETDKEGTTFETTGYGHGVGMCQYGAEGLAGEGRDFRAILGYYYHGIAFGTVE